MLLENRVYVLGGEGIDKKILNSMLVLTDWGWDRAKEMNLERKRLSCAVFRERIWACGGTMTYHRRKEATSSRTSAITIPHKTCESYHPQVLLLGPLSRHLFRVNKFFYFRTVGGKKLRCGKGGSVLLLLSLLMVSSTSDCLINTVRSVHNWRRRRVAQ